MKELKIDNVLDNNLRPMKIDEISAPIELATNKIRITEDSIFTKDLTIEGDLFLEGSTADIKMTDSVNIRSTATAGYINFEALGLMITANAYTGEDGDDDDNEAVIALFPSADYDAKILLYSSGAQIEWTIGNDADDSDKLKFDAGTPAVGGATKLTLEDDGDLITVGDVSLAATKKLYLDGGTETYIVESGDDILDIYVGGDKLLSFDESVDSGVTSLIGTFKIKEQVGASADTTAYGQIWTKNDAPNVFMFTDDTGIDVNISSSTAVWGGQFARTGIGGTWHGIPTGHQTAVITFGTGASPDTSYAPSTTADDLCGVIWNTMNTILVKKCRIWYGQGGATNTRHTLCLMRYDIDASGDLSAGVIVGSNSDSGSDDYTTLAFTDLTMTTDNAVSATQVLIAMAQNKDAYNQQWCAKCIIEYQETS